mgnify:CR=1 FL=1
MLLPNLTYSLLYLLLHWLLHSLLYRLRSLKVFRDERWGDLGRVSSKLSIKVSSLSHHVRRLVPKSTKLKNGPDPPDGDAPDALMLTLATPADGSSGGDGQPPLPPLNLGRDLGRNLRRDLRRDLARDGGDGAPPPAARARYYTGTHMHARLVLGWFVNVVHLLVVLLACAWVLLKADPGKLLKVDPGKLRIPVRRIPVRRIPVSCAS